MLLFSIIPIVYCLDNPYIIYDDTKPNYYTEWSNSYSWTLSDNINIVRVGNSSLKIIIPAHSQYEAISIPLLQTDLTTYDNFGFWLKGNASDTTLRIGLQTDSSNFYYNFITDSVQLWRFIEYETFDDFSTFGSPNNANILYYEIAMSSDNGNEITLYIDYPILSIGNIVPTPAVINVINPTFFISLMLFLLNLILIFKPIPILAIPLGLMTIVLLAVNFAGNANLPLQPYYSFIIFMVSAISIFTNGSDMRD